MQRYRLPGIGNIPPVVKNLLIINVLLFIATYGLQSLDIDLNKYLALYYFKSEYFRPYQFITHMFMHGGITHIFMNMFMLWMFGKVLESVWGAQRFIIYYFVTGLGAAVLHTFVNWMSYSDLMESANTFINTPSPDLFSRFINEYMPEYKTNVYDFTVSWANNPNSASYIEEAQNFVSNRVQFMINIPTVGASGAIYGVLLAFGVLFPNTILMLIFPPIPIKAKYMVMIMGGLELYLSVTQPGDHIAHAAHLGGMIFGYILIRYWKKDTRHFY